MKGQETIEELAAADPNNTTDTDREEETPDGDGSFLDDTQWPDEKLAKHLIALWVSRNPELRPQLLRWEVNERRRRGDRWVGLVKNPDRQEWRIYTPPGGAKTPPTLGKGARLCRRLTSQMFQDPPTPEAIPASDSDEARGAAEFSSRLLQALDSEASTNSARSARQAYNKSHTCGSGFRHHWVDPYGGGQSPKRMYAHPQADTQQDATEYSLKGPEGLPVQGQDGQPVRLPHDPKDLTLRMTTAEGGFTEQADEAEQIFLPAIKHEVLTGRQVRFFPPTALGIDTAELVLILSWKTLGELRSQYDEAMESMPDEALTKMVEWTPDGEMKYLLPDHLRWEDIQRSREKKDQTYQDGALVCTLIAYQKACVDHPDGACLIVGGPDQLLQRNPWVAEVHGTRLVLDLPLDQTKGYDEGVDSQYGFGTMDFLGPGDELLANIDGAWITHFQRFSNRKVFVPITSALANKVMTAGTGTYIPINPGGEPKTEDVPTFPSDTIQLRNTVVENLDDESGLQRTAQGVDSPNVQSGFHAVQVIEQVLAGLSESRQNVSDAIERGWRIDLQLIRAFYTVPMQTRFLGEDQNWKYDDWMASDLGDTLDVRLVRGTFSMMSPAMKSSIAVSMKQAGVISDYELRRMTIGNTGGLIGLQDDAHWLRINRQIAAWKKGPPEGWAPAPPVDPMAAGMPPATDPAMQQAQTTPAPVSSPAQGPWTPFETLPIDQDPGIAMMRVQELGRAMAGTAYAKFPLEWRQLLDAAYQQAVLIVNPPPPPPPPPTGIPSGAQAFIMPIPQVPGGLPPESPTPNQMTGEGAPQLTGSPMAPGLPPKLQAHYPTEHG